MVDDKRRMLIEIQWLPLSLINALHALQTDRTTGPGNLHC